MAFIFQSPLTFLQSTGLTIDPNNTELFGKQRKNKTSYLVFPNRKQTILNSKII